MVSFLIENLIYHPAYVLPTMGSSQILTGALMEIFWVMSIASGCLQLPEVPVSY